MIIRNVQILGLLGLFASAILGCGGPTHPQTCPATGTVVYQGKPVEGADVTFMPHDGRIATGRTDAEGRFHLSTFEAADGAIAGDHVVLVVKKEKIDDPQTAASPYDVTRDVLPRRYGNAAQSGLTATVDAAGKNDFRFELND